MGARRYLGQQAKINQFCVNRDRLIHFDVLELAGITGLSAVGFAFAEESMLHVLLIGENLLLLSATAAALRRSGASVESSCFSDAPWHLMRRGFDLLVLCSTLTEQKAEAVSRLVHQDWPEMRILQVLPGKRNEKRAADSGMAATESSPPKLVLLPRENDRKSPDYSM